MQFVSEKRIYPQIALIEEGYRPQGRRLKAKNAPD